MNSLHCEWADWSTEVLARQRAAYGEEILPSLAIQLALYGREFGEKEPASGRQIRDHVPRRADCRDSVATI